MTSSTRLSCTWPIGSSGSSSRKKFTPPSAITPKFPALAQSQVQLVDHLSPIRILADFLLQQRCLGGRPEVSLGQQDFRRQRAMRLDEAFNGLVVMRQAKLGEQFGKTVKRGLHGGFPLVLKMRAI